MNGLEKEFPFCSNSDCVLYVRVGDPGVMGPAIGPNFPTAGSWVVASIAAYISAIGADANGVPFLHFIHELPCKLAAIT